MLHEGGTIKLLPEASAASRHQGGSTVWRGILEICHSTDLQGPGKKSKKLWAGILKCNDQSSSWPSYPNVLYPVLQGGLPVQSCFKPEAVEILERTLSCTSRKVCWCSHEVLK